MADSTKLSLNARAPEGSRTARRLRRSGEVPGVIYGGDGEPVFTARFGEFNPEGYLQYMRIDGNPRLYLMSRFVGGEWSEVMTEAAAR